MSDTILMPEMVSDSFLRKPVDLSPTFVILQVSEKKELLEQKLKLYEYEREWFECKENRINVDEPGQYISALSDSAASFGQKNGYFIRGIHDRTHEITGTDFNPDMEQKNEPIKHYLARKLSPDPGFEFQQTVINSKRVVV